jgi:hypothetical protein
MDGFTTAPMAFAVDIERHRWPARVAKCIHAGPTDEGILFLTLRSHILYERRGRVPRASLIKVPTKG